jgi:hypothetical protein
MDGELEAHSHTTPRQIRQVTDVAAMETVRALSAQGTGGGIGSAGDKQGKGTSFEADQIESEMRGVREERGGDGRSP